MYRNGKYLEAQAAHSYPAKAPPLPLSFRASGFVVYRLTTILQHAIAPSPHLSLVTYH